MLLPPSSCSLLATVLLACTALGSALPRPESSESASNRTAGRADKAPFFILIGDSTTAPIQPWKGSTPPGGGGWGDGFLGTLTNGASGINLGKNGQTTVSYRENGHWKLAVAKIGEKIGTHDVWVTCQFGHNDQKTASGISLSQYEANLEKMVKELSGLKANVILVTPLTRRSFTSSGTINTSLDNESAKTKEAAANTKAAVIDLNGASKKYVQAIGKAEATKLDADYRDAKDAATAKDNTHLNKLGSAVFGRMVADLVVGRVEGLGRWVRSDKALSAAIAAGKPVSSV